MSGRAACYTHGFLMFMRQDPYGASTVWGNIIKIQMCSAKNISNVWIRRNNRLVGTKILANPCHFFHGPKNNQNNVQVLPILGPCCYPPEVGKLVQKQPEGSRLGLVGPRLTCSALWVDCEAWDAISCSNGRRLCSSALEQSGEATWWCIPMKRK